jgi:hypothetical protein
MSAMAAYLASVSRALGKGAWEAFSSLNVTNSDFIELSKSNKLGGLRRGQSLIDEITGNRYRIVRARGAITGLGYIVKNYLGAAGRLGNLTAASTKAVLTTDDTFVAHDLAGGYVFLNAGTGLEQLRPIIDNDDTSGASTITLATKDRSFPGSHTAVDSADALATAPDATTDYLTVLPWEIVETSAVTDYVVGVALGAVTDGNWTIVLDEGYGLVRAAGDTDALVLDEGIVPSAAAGTAKGLTTAGTLADEAHRVFARALAAKATAASNWFCHVRVPFPIGAH